MPEGLRFLRSPSANDSQTTKKVPSPNARQHSEVNLRGLKKNDQLFSTHKVMMIAWKTRMMKAKRMRLTRTHRQENPVLSAHVSVEDPSSTRFHLEEKEEEKKIMMIMAVRSFE
jgi:hypothetical protein